MLLEKAKSIKEQMEKVNGDKKDKVKKTKEEIKDKEEWKNWWWNEQVMLQLKKPEDKSNNIEISKYIEVLNNKMIFKQYFEQTKKKIQTRKIYSSAKPDIQQN